MEGSIFRPDTPRQTENLMQHRNIVYGSHDVTVTFNVKFSSKKQG